MTRPISWPWAPGTRCRAFSACGAMILLACIGRVRGEAGPEIAFDENVRSRVLRHSPLPDPPADPTNRWADDPEAAALGQMIFFDPRLSANGKVSCASCHDPAKSFADGRPLAQGVGTADRHAPALWNVAYQRWFFWDGRVDSLWAQFVVPLEHPREMGFSRGKLVALIRCDGRLHGAYEELFGALPDPSGDSTRDMSLHDRSAVDTVVANIGKAVAAYQRKLISRRAPFDVFVEGLRTGDADRRRAITASAQRGLKLFVTKGECRLCHVGPTFSDAAFHNLGAPPAGGGEPNDPGRFRGAALVREHEFNASSPFSDARDSPAARRLRRLAPANESWGAFKTPTLRNVARTAPYMHAGQFASLRDVLHFYSTLDGQVRAGHHQEQIIRPLNLSEQEMDDLIAFLESLTDERIDSVLLRPPSGR